MGLPGSSPRWREVEAKFRPAVVPQPIIPPAIVLPPFEAIQKLTKRIAIPVHIEPRRCLASDIILANDIICLVAEKHGLSVNDILCDSRLELIMIARQEACYEIAGHTLLSLTNIGKVLGGRDHSTVKHGIRRHIERTGLPHVRGLSALSRPPGYEPRSKWLDGQLIELFVLRAEGLKRVQIAERLGKSLGSIKWAFRVAASRGFRSPSKSTPAD